MSSGIVKYRFSLDKVKIQNPDDSINTMINVIDGMIIQVLVEILGHYPNMFEARKMEVSAKKDDSPFKSLFSPKEKMLLTYDGVNIGCLILTYSKKGFRCQFDPKQKEL